MKKLTCLLALVLLVQLFGCSDPHKHTWTAATCENPETCTGCSETKGEPLKHDWLDATCASAQKCVRCGQLQGTPLGHDWEEATCTKGKTCINCGKSSGEPLEHSWIEATTTAPKTCENCQKTEGEKLESGSSGKQNGQVAQQGGGNNEKPSNNQNNTTPTEDKNKNQEAIEAAYEIAETYAMVCPNMIRDILMDDYGFTDTQAMYAVRHIDIDWNMYATSHLEEYVGISQEEGYYVSKADAEKYLYISKGYSDAAIQYAMANADVDWSINAEDTTMPTEEIASPTEYTEEDLD